MTDAQPRESSGLLSSGGSSLAGTSRQESRFFGLPLSQWRAVALGAAIMLMAGYDEGMIDAAMLTLRTELKLSEVEEEVAIGILNLAAAVGGLVLGPMADSHGRKYAIMLALVLYLLGAGIITFAVHVWFIMAGRVVMGFGVGTALVAGPMFVAEIVPADQRGSIVASVDLSTDFGVVAGYAVGYVFVDQMHGWRWMFAVAAIPLVLVLVAIGALLPESPRWLVAQGRSAAARDALRDLGLDAVEAERMLEVMRTSMLRAVGGQAGPSEAGWAEVVWPRDRMVRQMLLVGVGVAFFSQATGTDATIYYTPEVLQESGVSNPREDLLYSMGVGLAQVFFLLVGMACFDNLGRRPMLLLGCVGLAAAFVVEGVSVLVRSSSLAISGLLGVVAAYNISFSPLTFVVCTEVFTARIRAKALALALFTARLMSGLLSLSFISLQETITPAGLWFAFAGLSLLALAFVYVYVPETRALQLEEVEDTFRERARRLDERARLLMKGLSLAKAKGGAS